MELTQDLLWTLLTDGLWDRLFHPFGDLRAWRWGAFAAVFAAFVAFPLIYRRAFRRAEADALSRASATGGIVSTNVNLGPSWIIIGLLGMAVLGALVALPYTMTGLEWKTFNPFDPKGNARTITFLLVIPAIVGLSAITYWTIRKPVSQPVKLVLAGTRALALWLIFILICAPYTMTTRVAERPYRAMVLLDDSVSMGETVREFPIASPVRIADSVRAQLGNSSDPADQRRLAEIERLAAEDASAALALGPELRSYGLPEPQTVDVELADIEPIDFEMRDFVRELVLSRATRLRAKIRLIHGRDIDLGDWQRRQSELTALRSGLRLKSDELYAEQQRDNPDQGRLASLALEVERLQEELNRKSEEFTAIAEEGALAQALGQAAISAEGEERRRLEEGRARVVAATRTAVHNLLSTLDHYGPTRWDIACELLQPGNMLTIQQPSGLRLLELALTPASGQLTLLDLLRRNRTRQPDRLPRDIAELAAKVRFTLPAEVVPPAVGEGLREPLSLFLFSEADPSRGTSGLLRQNTPEDLDFIQPSGRTTQFFAAFNTALAGENSGDLATVLVISDGHDTSRRGTSESEAARETVAALQSARDAPVVITVAVGHPRPERVLALQAVGGDDEVILDELVTLDLRIRANASWKDTEIVLCENSPTNEIKYLALNGETGRTKIDVEGAPAGGMRTVSVKLTFKPETGGRHRYWVKLNRRRMPGEDTYDNNVLIHELNVIDRKIRVLLMEQAFRWESRYLMEALIRDKTLEVHTFFLDADHGWPQRSSEYSQKARMDMPPLVALFGRIINGGTPNSRTARANTKDQWFESNYDVVIVGDVDPTQLTFRGAQWLNEWVTQRRGGIIWLAGKKHNPFSYTDPDLADLLPVKVGRPSDFDQVDTGRMKYYGLTLAGRGHEITRFSPNPQRQEELWGGILRGAFNRGQLDGYYWYAKTRGPRDEVSTVLARVAEQARPLSDTSDGADALIVSREIGTGRSLFVGTDELWRMRRFFGDFYTYRFWQNAIRWAATSRLKAKKEGIDLHTDEKRYLLDQPVTVFCDLLGDSEQYRSIQTRQQDAVRRALDSEAELDPNQKHLLVRWQNRSSEARGNQVQDGFDEGLLLLRETSPNHFEGTLHPNTIGKYELSVVNEPATTKNPTLFFVEASSEQLAELRETEVNTEALISMSTTERIGTAENSAERPRFVRFFEAEKINPDLRTRTIEVGKSEKEAFSLLELLLVIAGLFAAEWLIRKLVRLA